MCYSSYATVGTQVLNLTDRPTMKQLCRNVRLRSRLWNRLVLAGEKYIAVMINFDDNEKVTGTIKIIL